MGITPFRLAALGTFPEGQASLIAFLYEVVNLF